MPANDEDKHEADDYAGVIGAAQDAVDFMVPPSPREVVRQYTMGSIAAQLDIHTHGLYDYYKLRVIWAQALLAILAFLVLLQSLFVLAVGLGWVRLETDQWFFRLQAGVYFAQIVSLCLIVVRSLFRESLPDIVSAITRSHAGISEMGTRLSRERSADDGEGRDDAAPHGEQ